MEKIAWYKIFKATIKVALNYKKVGVRRFELPAPGPPDQYSNLAELYPDFYCLNVKQKNYLAILL